MNEASKGYEPSNDSIPSAEWSLAEREARVALRVQRDNERFAAAGPAQKRVMVARDGLKWLRAKKWLPGHHYISVIDTGSSSAFRPGIDKVNGYKCEACALGGILACVAERGATSIQKEPGSLLKEGADIWKSLEGIFDMEQLLLIEAAYEGGVQTPRHVRDAMHEEGLDPTAAYEWRATYPDDTERLQAILRNIIANKGTFVP